MKNLRILNVIFAKNIIERAQLTAQSLLETHEVEPLSNDVIKELNLIVKEAEKELVSLFV